MVTSVDTITPDFLPPAVPHHGTSHWFSAYSYGNPVVSELAAPVYNNVAIASIIPTDPLFPPCLRPQRPYHVGEDITEVGRGTRFIRIEDRDDIYYWITCRMDNTGVEFSMRVGRDLVIDPNPQDMLSQLARVGSLMRLWWGHLSELVRWS